MNKAHLIFLAFIISFVCCSQNNKYDWNLKKSENGINVYSRKTESSAFKELKSVVYIKTSLSSIITLIYDWENYPKWVYKCGRSSKLKSVKDTMVHYQTVVVPWPFENRDFIASTVFSQDKLTDIITITSVNNPKFIPEVKSHQRITELKAIWTLVPLKEGNVQITYQLFVNPGGSIPAALVNFAAVNGPYETMVNFKEQIMKKKYQEAKVLNIKESK
ncbi:MAG TPA: hypothetical protein VN026_07050 [Bacteroidia bacterium]|jgi:hypothetical protein|nr:hypothetical protein [Bacteroidia bacterium]